MSIGEDTGDVIEWVDNVAGGVNNITLSVEEVASPKNDTMGQSVTSCDVTPRLTRSVYCRLPSIYVIVDFFDIIIQN